MRASRRTQPYRKGARQQTGALAAMLRGRGVSANPMDPARELQKNASRRKRKRRRRHGTLAQKLTGY